MFGRLKGQEFANLAFSGFLFFGGSVGARRDPRDPG